jgi:hypothetical protein
MKTFLHYTKEKELEEGFFDRLAGIGGAAVRGLAKAGEYASISRQAFSGVEQGAKSGDGLRGGSGAAGSIVGKAETDTKEKAQLAGDKAECIRKLNYYQNLLNDARSQGKSATKILASMDRVKSECKGIMKASTYDKLAKEREIEDKNLITDFDSSVAGKKGFDKYG